MVDLRSSLLLVVCGVNTVARVCCRISQFITNGGKRNQIQSNLVDGRLSKRIGGITVKFHLFCLKKNRGTVGVERRQVVIDMVLISLQSFSWTVRGANIHTFRSYTRGRKGEIDTNTSGRTVRIVNLGGSKKKGYPP